MTTPAPGYQAGVGPTCPQHPGSRALVRCQRCGRPVCPACQVPAAVGVQCPQCVQAGSRARPMLRSVLGAPLTQGTPAITIGAITLCLVTFLAQLATREQLTQDWILAPGLVWHQPWRMVTAGFLHANWIHLGLNLYCLWVVGGFVERLVGRWRFAALYLGSMLGGHAAVLVYFRLFDFTYGGALSGTLGASGAVFGVFGAALILARRLGGDVRGIATVIALNLVIGFMGANISWQGHLGGLLLGGAIAAVYAYAPPRKRQLYAVLAVSGVLLLVGLTVVLTVGLI